MHSDQYPCVVPMILSSQSCLRFRSPRARMSAKMSQDAKKDEFRKYLEKAGVLELLTKSLVQLYEVS